MQVEKKKNKRTKAPTAVSKKGRDKLGWMGWGWGVRKERRLNKYQTSEKTGWFANLALDFYLVKYQGFMFKSCYVPQSLFYG